MPVLVTSNFDDDSIKNERASMEAAFSHYKSMGAICCHGNQSFDPICPKTSCSLSPTPLMLHIKYIGQLASEINKLESVDNDTGTDHWYTKSSLCEPSAQVS